MAQFMRHKFTSRDSNLYQMYFQIFSKNQIWLENTLQSMSPDSCMLYDCRNYQSVESERVVASPSRRHQVATVRMNPKT